MCRLSSSAASPRVAPTANHHQSSFPHRSLLRNNATGEMSRTTTPFTSLFYSSLIVIWVICVEPNPQLDDVWVLARPPAPALIKHHNLILSKLLDTFSTLLSVLIVVSSRMWFPLASWGGSHCRWSHAGGEGGLGPAHMCMWEKILRP